MTSSMSGRLMVVALAGVTALGLAACGSGASDSAASGASGASSSGLDVGVGQIHPKGDSKTIAVMINGTPSISFSAAQAAAAKSEAAKLGYRVDVLYANLDPSTELSNFQHVLSSGSYAGLILDPVNTQLCVPMKTQALQHNLPVEVIANALCDDGTGSGDELWAPGTLSYIGGLSNLPGVQEVLAAAAKQLTGPQKVGLVLGPQGHATGSVAWQTAWKAFAGAEQPRPQALFARDWREEINATLHAWLGERGLALSALKRGDRVALVAALDARGLFQTRNAVDHLASLIGASRASIYNYLAAARGEAP